MREYASREAAERDRDLDLRIIWRCTKCRAEREEPPGYNEGGECHCGGEFVEVGQSYNA